MGEQKTKQELTIHAKLYHQKHNNTSTQDHTDKLINMLINRDTHTHTERERVSLRHARTCSQGCFRKSSGTGEGLPSGWSRTQHSPRNIKRLYITPLLCNHFIKNTLRRYRISPRQERGGKRWTCTELTLQQPVYQLPSTCSKAARQQASDSLDK